MTSGRRSDGPRPLVTVANRLPISKTAGGWQPSAGGLVTALRPVMARRPGAWIGWDGGTEGAPAQVDGFEVDFHPVSLSKTQVQSYYHGFSNRTIWPLFHDLVQTPVFERSWWRSYREVNERFAEHTLSLDLVDEDPVLWVQDYHLMLVPNLLREAKTGGAIAFFLHIPWPPPELFTRLPWRVDILEGLLGADVITFHTERYRKNFARTCGRLLDVTVKGRSIIMPDGREVRTSSNPISIDAGEFSELAQSEEVAEELEHLHQQFAGRQVLVGVDRLDYTKGIPERLLAVERLLQRRSDLRERLAFIQIAVPSRSTVREYRELRSQIEESTGRINGRFTEPGQEVPLYYFHRGVSRRGLIAYYRLADAMLVTPLKDGMNLVAKEYVVCQGATGGAGALVLSEFTGAALELPEAISCNPFDTEGLSYRIEEALEMDEDERRKRVGAMAENIARNDVHRWVERELREVERATR